MSLILLGTVVILALAGLAYESNWPKLARVGTSFLTYVVVLLVAGGGHSRGGPHPPYLAFALAGAACGLVSGLVREDIRPPIIAVGAAAGALLLGGVHWLALRAWRRLGPFPER